MIIALMGFMGCGKSSVGREAARRLGWRFVDLDDAVAERVGTDVQGIFEREGEAAFRRHELSALKDLINHNASDLVLSLGGGTPTIRQAAALLRSNAYLIYLCAKPEILRSRLEKEVSGRPLLRDGGLDKLPSLLQRREGVYDGLSDSTIIVDNLGLEELVDEVLRVICKLRHR